MFALYPSLKDVLDHGGTLFIDDIFMMQLIKQKKEENFV